MVIALEAAAQGEFLAAVVEGGTVVAEGGIVGGEGVVQVQQVVIGAGGGAGEFVFEQDDLQPGVGVRAADGPQQRGRRVLLLSGPGADQGGEQPLGQDGLTGLAGVEGQQQPPLSGQLAVDVAGFHLAAHLVGQPQPVVAAAGPVQQVHRGPHAGLRPHQRPAC